MQLSRIPRASHCVYSLCPALETIALMAINENLSPQHLGRLDYFPTSVGSGPGGTSWALTPQLSRKVPTSLPSAVPASTPGGVLFPIKPMARPCWDNQDKQGLCPQETPARRIAGLHPREDSAAPLAAPERGASGSGAEAPSRQGATGVQQCLI